MTSQVAKNHNVPKEDAGLQVRLGRTIKNYRKRMGISQEELAWRADMHRTYVADIERGARNLSLSSIQRLARALEISVAALLSTEVERGVRPEEKDRAPGRGHAVDILLVEDNRNDADLTLCAFERAKITNPIHVVRDGVEALDFLFCRGPYASRDAKERPQVVLLDLMLPKLHGLGVLRQMREDARTATMPVVVLTSSSHDPDMLECARLGVEAYITKPVDFRSFSSITPKLDLHWTLLKPFASG